MIAANLPAADRVARGDRLRRELAVCLSDVAISVNQGSTDKLASMKALLTAAQAYLTSITPAQP